MFNFSFFREFLGKQKYVVKFKQDFSKLLENFDYSKNGVSLPTS